MQTVILYKAEKSVKRVQYVCHHPKNSKYLEREDEADTYKLLSDVDNVSNATFVKNEEFAKLIGELVRVINEAKMSGDNDVVNHLKEIIVLCKLCLWSDSVVFIEFSPFGVSSEKYPELLPEGCLNSLPDDL